jgi:hypothetical protein
MDGQGTELSRGIEHGYALIAYALRPSHHTDSPPLENKDTKTGYMA